MNTEPYCEEKGAPEGSTAYYRLLFAAEARRPALTALYALCTEIGSIAHEVSEVDAARMKLAWWGEEIDRLFAGSPRHPVTRALRPHVDEHGLARELFEQLLAASAADIDHPGYADAEDLLRHARMGAAAQRLETELCGYREPATREFAEALGIALQLTRIVRDVRSDAARGRVYLPADRLDAHGVRPAALLQPPTPAPLRELVAAEAARANAHFGQALRILPPADHWAQCSALVGAAIQRRLLAEIEHDGYRVLEHRVDLTPVRKLWIAWRTARRARRTTARQRSHPL